MITVFEEKLQGTSWPTEISNCSIFPITHTLTLYTDIWKCLVLKMKQAARDNEPSGGCVSTYIAHQLQNTLIIILLIIPLSQYTPKSQKCQVSMFLRYKTLASSLASIIISAAGFKH